MHIQRTATYSTLIASVNNRDAITGAQPLSLPKEPGQRQPEGKATLPPAEKIASLSATIERTGRKAKLSPFPNIENLNNRTKNALINYISIQNQLQSDEQQTIQQLLGIDYFV